MQSRATPSHKAKSMLPRPIYLGSATRTPIGKFGGSLRRFNAAQLATLCLEEAMRRSQSTAKADFVFLGHARQAGAGPNVARQATVFSGLGADIPAITINQACASGMTAIFCAMEKIFSGRAARVWAGGVESMSNTPYLLKDVRWGLRLGHQKVIDGMYQDGFLCPMADMIMGETVERFIAAERHISRDDQDAYALRSQRRAIGAVKTGAFHGELFDIPADGKLPGLQSDEHLRIDASMEGLKKLPPVFDPDNGTITAGNSSGITDGAAFVEVSKDRNNSHQVEVLDYATVALDPKRMGMGPVPAIRELLGRQGLSVEDIDVFEINEAFAAQVLACQSELQIPIEKLNPLGGSIAIGHPIGASGARITVTLIHQLIKKSGSLGISSLCVSGGQGVALLLRAL